jgi:hypothetical protein
MADKAKPQSMLQRKATEDDVEGHAHRTLRVSDDEKDVEGHSMLPNSGLNRQLAQAREREIQQSLKRREFETDARASKKDRR